MTRPRCLAFAAVCAAVLAATAAAGTSAPRPPIVIGAVVDLSNVMAPFDAPALHAAQLEIAKVNAHGGVLGRRLKLISLDDRLDPAKTKQFAQQMLRNHVDIGWVTCDVNYAYPAAAEFLAAGKLTVSPCLGSDELSPIAFGKRGKLGFSFGSAAQDEGAAAAEFAYKAQHYRTAVVVTDELLRSFQELCRAFTVRFTELGGKVVAQEHFTQFKGEIAGVVSRVNNEAANVIALCTSFGVDQPAFVSGLRSLNNNTPIVNGSGGDGRYWWPSSPPVSDFYYLTPASVYGDDPSARVRAFEARMKKAGHPPTTGGFVGGAAAIDGIVTALQRDRGDTNGAALAAQMVKFRKVPTLSGNVSFSAKLHAVSGRSYRVIQVQQNRATVVKLITASSPANIGR